MRTPCVRSVVLQLRLCSLFVVFRPSTVKGRFAGTWIWHTRYCDRPIRYIRNVKNRTYPSVEPWIPCRSPASLGFFFFNLISVSVFIATSASKQQVGHAHGILPSMILRDAMGPSSWVLPVPPKRTTGCIPRLHSPFLRPASDFQSWTMSTSPESAFQASGSKGLEAHVFRSKQLGPAPLGHSLQPPCLSAQRPAVAPGDQRNGNKQNVCGFPLALMKCHEAKFNCSPRIAGMVIRHDGVVWQQSAAGRRWSPYRMIIRPSRVISVRWWQQSRFLTFCSCLFSVEV